MNNMPLQQFHCNVITRVYATSAITQLYYEQEEVKRLLTHHLHLKPVLTGYVFLSLYFTHLHIWILLKQFSYSEICGGLRQA